MREPADDTDKMRVELAGAAAGSQASFLSEKNDLFSGNNSTPLSDLYGPVFQMSEYRGKFPDPALYGGRKIR